MSKINDRARELRARADTSQAEASAAWDALVTAKAALADADIPEGKSITDLPEYQAADTARKAYDAAAAQASKDGNEYKAVLELLGTEAPAEPLKAAEPTAEPTASMGEKFVTSDVYKALRDRLPEARGSKVPVGTTERVAVATREQAKKLFVPRGAVFSTPDDVIAPDQLGGIKQKYQQPLTILDLITMASTDSTTVKWVREKAFTNAAAEVAETTEATRASNAKPESKLELETVSFDVRTIAHWLPASKQSLRDIAGLRSLIDAKLVWGLQKRLATQVMNGDGIGENILGITNTPGIGSIEASGTTAAALISDLYDACTTVVDAYGEQPNVAFVSRADYKKLRFATLGTDGAGGYIFGPPTAATPVEIEGTLVLPSADVTNPIVGVWREYAVWMHEGIGLSVSDSHDDFFIRNLAAILAEFSAAAGAMETVAFCEVAPAPAG